MVLHESPAEETAEAEAEDIEGAVDEPHLGHGEGGPGEVVAEAKAEGECHGGEDGEAGDAVKQSVGDELVGLGGEPQLGEGDADGTED